MAVKIRLLRTSKTSFRIIVADSSRTSRGKFIEIIGHYSPTRKEFKIKEDRLKYWKQVGAQLTDTLSSLIKKYSKSSHAPT